VLVSIRLDCDVEIEGMSYRGMVAVMASLDSSWGTRWKLDSMHLDGQPPGASHAECQDSPVGTNSPTKPPHQMMGCQEPS
jgi:hypothetical protein